MIHGWKNYLETGAKPGVVPTHRTSCDVNDPECTIWDVVGPGSPHWMSIECDSLYKAQRLEARFTAAFEAGRAARAQEFRDFIARL
jgi:hypothetical protein